MEAMINKKNFLYSESLSNNQRLIDFARRTIL
jgi:hypothetical protein